MKKKVITIILVFLMYVILTSCTSCTNGSAQSPQRDTTPNYQDSPIIFPQDTLKLTTFPKMIAENIQDTGKRIVIRKEIMKMEIDTVRSAKMDSMYQELEKTQRGLKVQQRKIDSMIVIKKK